MTDDSSFVLRWEIDNAKARFKTGKVESEVFDKKGFKWTMIAEKDVDREEPISNQCRTNFALKCNAGHNGKWKCDAEIGVLNRFPNGIHFRAACSGQRFCFNENSHFWIHKVLWIRSSMTYSSHTINDKVIMEFKINVISSQPESGELIADPSMFSAPNRMSNVILKIGDKQLHVSKEYLSVQSPVFETLFFGEFAEKGKEGVEIKDVVYEEFIDLLHLAYQITINITDHTVVHILKLADRFQMENILSHAKLYLTESKGIDVISKLLVADQYSLVNLKVHCLQSFDNSTELLGKMLAFPEYDKFSADMKAAVFDRIKELKMQ